MGQIKPGEQMSSMFRQDTSVAGGGQKSAGPARSRRLLVLLLGALAALCLCAHALVCRLHGQPPGARQQLDAAAPENSGWLLFVAPTAREKSRLQSAARQDALEAAGEEPLVAFGLELDEAAGEQVGEQVERDESAPAEMAARNGSARAIPAAAAAATASHILGVVVSSGAARKLINKSAPADEDAANNRPAEPTESFKNAATESLKRNQTTGGEEAAAPARQGKRLKRRAGAAASERGKPILNEFSFPANLVQGMRFVLMCQVLDGEPPIQIKWFKDNLDLSSLLQLAQDAKLNGGLAGGLASSPAAVVQQNQNLLEQLEMMSNDELGASLLFRRVKQQHGGNYTCVASNHFGSAAYSSLMTVKVPPSWRLEPQDHESIMGEHITIDCQATGNPNPFIRWKFTSVQHDKTPPSADQLATSQQRQQQQLADLGAPMPQAFQQLPPLSGFKLINSNHHVQTLENGSLTIRQAGAEHEGLYLCEADNGVEPSLIKQIRLVVRRQAHFLDDIQVVAQQAAGEPARHQQSLELGQQQQQLQQPSQLLSAAGPQTMQTSQVVASIKSIKLPQNSSLVRLACAPFGDPPLQLDWLKDGRLIHTHSSNGPPAAATAQLGEPIDHQAASAQASEQQQQQQQQQQHLSQTIGRYHVSTRWLAGPAAGNHQQAGGGGKFAPAGQQRALAGEPNGLESELLLTNLARHDAGLYTCAARNAYGQAERKLRLVVQEQPEAPSMVDVAHISSRMISLRWLAPFDGNSPIVKYAIEYRKLAPIPQDPVVAATALNAADLDAWAPGSAAALGRSEKLMPVLNSASALLIKPPPLQPPPSNGEAMDTFGGQQQEPAASLHQQQQQQQLQLAGGAGAQIQHTVHELEPMTRYSMRVLAYNALGASRPSVSLVLRTEEEVPATVPNLVEASVLSSKSIKLRWTISYSLEHELIDGFFIGYRSYDATLAGPAEQAAAAAAGAPRQGDEAAKMEQPTFTYKTIRLTNNQQQEPAAGSGERAHSQTPLLSPVSSITKSVLADTLGKPLLGGGGGGGLRSGMQQPQQQQREVAFVISNFEHVIGGLERNTEYTILIQCFNKKGAGPASDPVVARTLASDPPEKLTLQAEELSETSLRVQWHFRGESRHAAELPPAMAPPSGGGGQQGAVERNPVDGFVLTFAKVAPQRQKAAPAAAASPQQQQQQQQQQLYSRATSGDGRPGDMAARISQAPNASLASGGGASNNGGSQLQLQQQQQANQLLEHQWQAIQLAPQQRGHVLKNLECGTWYAMEIWAFNKIGKGEPSELVTASTRGKAPVAPDRRSFLTINTTSVRLNLNAWYDGGCEIEKFSVQYRARGQPEWILVSSGVLKEQGAVLIRDLSAANTYELLVGAQNHVGRTEAKYRFSTLDAEGKPVAVSNSFLGGNLPTIDDENLVVDYTDDAGTMRELFGPRGSAGGSGSGGGGGEGSLGARWLLLVRQVLNSPLTLLLAFTLFLVLLVLLVFHRLNANASGAPSDRFGGASSCASSSKLNGAASCTAGGGARRCSLDGTATMLDGEPPMSMTNGSSLADSPTARAPNGAGGPLGSAHANGAPAYSPVECYNGTYCTASRQAPPQQQHSQQQATSADSHLTHLTHAQALGNYGMVQPQQQQQADYYSPSIYAGVHRSATMDGSRALNGSSAIQQQQAEADCRQQYLMQMLMMSPQAHQPLQGHYNGDPGLASNVDAGGQAGYSMAAAALTTLARQKAGLLRPPGGGSGQMAAMQAGGNAMTLGRHLAADGQQQQQHARCTAAGEQQVTFQPGNSLLQASRSMAMNSMTTRCENLTDGAYQTTTFCQRQLQQNVPMEAEVVRRSGVDLAGIYRETAGCSTAANSTTTSTSGHGTDNSSCSATKAADCCAEFTSGDLRARLAGAQTCRRANMNSLMDMVVVAEGGDASLAPLGGQQQICDKTKTETMKSQYDVPFKFTTATVAGCGGGGSAASEH